MQGTTFMDELFHSEPLVFGCPQGPSAHDIQDDRQFSNPIESFVELSYDLHVPIQFAFINLKL